MRYPLDNWESLATGYTFGQKTFYSDFHLGVDKGNRNDYGKPVYAPTDGRVVENHVGGGGGNTVHFKDSKGKLWRFLHLKSFARPIGPVKEGEILGYVGN